MFELTIKADSPMELYAKLEALFHANKQEDGSAPVPQVTVPLNLDPARVAGQVLNSYAPTPVAPVAPVTPVAPVAPTPAPITPVVPTPVVPTAAAPAYKFEDLAKAGAELAQRGKTIECVALLAKYGVQSVVELKQEQYGSFATELRTLGAQI